MDLDLHHYRLFVAGGVFLAATHAYRKLSPYFAITWFGAGLVFGYLWRTGNPMPEVVLLPALVVYLAAAVTKGLVETSERVAGNHVVHVILTGLFSGVIALPLEASARAMGWPLPRPASRVLLGVSPDWLGGVTLDAFALWVIVGTLFYGTYKVLDHIGLGKAVQTVLLFGAMPLLVMAAERVHGML